MREFKKAREDAKNFFGLLERLTRLASMQDPASFAVHLSNGLINKQGRDGPTAIRPLVQIASNINSLKEWSSFLTANFDVAEPLPSNLKPLQHHFCAALAEMHIKVFGTEHPKSKSGPFVQFAAAAWRDAGFPLPPIGSSNEKTLEDLLGRALERELPPLTQNKSLQTRQVAAGA